MIETCELCGQDLPDKPKQRCDRCGKVILQTWEHQWPIHGTLIVGRAAQIFVPLSGCTAPCGDDAAFTWWADARLGRYPFFVEVGAQDATIKWANNNEKLPNLCFECNDEFLLLLGRFFVRKP
jgi:hypothetical protein